MLVPGVDTGVDASSSGASCGLRVRYYGRAKGRYYAVFAGLSGGRLFFVHNNSLVNGIRGLVERVYLTPTEEGLVAPPGCSADVFARLGEARRVLARGNGVHRPVSRRDFPGFYKGRRRQVYERAVASLELSPLEKRDFRVRNAFVKAEKINGSSKPDPAPRVIQPRDPRYNVEVGRFLKPLEHRVYESIRDLFGGTPTVMKGYNAEQVATHMRAHWDEFNKPCAIGLDASRFDQHVRPEMLRWEHAVYLDCFKGPDRSYLAWLLEGQITNRCGMRCDDGSINYKVEGSRMSGDMNTALGNCLIMCALVYTLARERGVKVRLVNNGDDCVVFCEASDRVRLCGGLKEWFREFGFTMKVEPAVHIFEHVEFCQTRPVFDGRKWIMVRDPNVSCSKDACCTNRMYGYGRGARKWLHAVGDCGLNMSGGLPVLQEYYAAFMRHGVGGLKDTLVEETGMAFLRGSLRREWGEVADAARVSFWDAFGIDPLYQVALEEHLRAVTFDVPRSPCIVADARILIRQVPL